ncbi:MAG: tetraacyldisaccharide 4'-kinase [Candidatus Omnitrophota bacterium]
MTSLKRRYLSLLEKNNKNVYENIIYSFLVALSLLYGFIVRIRNFSYDKGVFSSTQIDKKVISIGNLSWAGSGKTTLALYLYRKLTGCYRIAILRRGYGNDEEKLLKEKGAIVFSNINRAALAKKLSPDYNIFILDDGFQHRKLKRDLDIVIMAAREFKGNTHLIPAYFFREPLSSLNRANILFISYREELSDWQEIKARLWRIFPHLAIYSFTYKPKRLLDFSKNEICMATLQGKRIAAIAAIGYPQGFFNKLRECKLDIVKTIAYPDHHEFTSEEFRRLQEQLKTNGIDAIIMTQKDTYHIPDNITQLPCYVLEVEIEIDDEEKFMEDVFKRIAPTV